MCCFFSTFLPFCPLILERGKGEQRLGHQRQAMCTLHHYGWLWHIRTHHTAPIPVFELTPSQCIVCLTPIPSLFFFSSPSLGRNSSLYKCHSLISLLSITFSVSLLRLLFSLRTSLSLNLHSVLQNTPLPFKFKTIPLRQFPINSATLPSLFNHVFPLNWRGV